MYNYSRQTKVIYISQVYLYRTNKVWVEVHVHVHVQICRSADIRTILLTLLAEFRNIYLYWCSRAANVYITSFIIPPGFTRHVLYAVQRIRIKSSRKETSRSCLESFYVFLEQKAVETPYIGCSCPNTDRPLWLGPAKRLSCSNPGTGSPNKHVDVLGWKRKNETGERLVCRKNSL